MQDIACCHDSEEHHNPTHLLVGAVLIRTQCQAQQAELLGVLVSVNAAVCLQGMEVDCPPEDSMGYMFDEDSVELCDVKDMRLEAEAVVNDVLFAVVEMHVSQNLSNAPDVAFINVETREGNRYCLELTEAGLRVGGAHKMLQFFFNLFYYFKK